MSEIANSTLDLHDANRRVCEALRDFQKHDSQLLELTADERAVTHQIAKHLELYFPSCWQVDCEYNRNIDLKKELPGIGRVRPDIIIHHRAKPENLLVIEVKTNKRNIKKDKEKLIEFTKTDGEFHYYFGLFLLFSSTKPFVITGEWYQDGKYTQDFVMHQNQESV